MTISHSGMRRVDLFMFILWLCLEMGALAKSDSGASDLSAHNQENGVGQRCRDKLPAAFINDDYCDCVDGSDEPETTACANGEFHCTNKGYIGKTIYSSMVDDGVCDCCDGSDEKKGHITCTNSCFEQASQFCTEWKNRIADYENGLSERVKVQKASTRMLASKQEELTRMEALIKEKTALQDALNRELEDAEDCECHCECNDNDQNESYHKPSSRERTKVGTKEEKKPDNGLSTESAQKSGSEDEESEARKIAARWQGASAAGAADEDSAEADIENEEYYGDDYGIYEHDGESYLSDYNYEAYGSDSVDYDFDDYDVEDRYENPEYSDGEKKEGSEEVSEPTADESRVEKTSIWYTIQERVSAYLQNVSYAVSGMYSRPKKTAGEIRRRVKAADTDIADARRKVTSLKTYSDPQRSNSFGPSYILLSVENDCYEYDSPEYTYKMCVTGTFTQKEKSGGKNTVTLGKFSEWQDVSTESADNDPIEAYLLYSSGQACYQGPNRSVKVAVKCGLKPAVLAITEPARCEYHAVLVAPFVCKEKTLSNLYKEYHGSFCADQRQTEL